MIEKIIHQIWVGELPPPKKWMASWQGKNPGWQYVLWDNDKIFGRNWENQRALNHYAKLKMWHGVADVARYEILREHGGFMPGADSECILPIDELFSDGRELYAVSVKGNPADWQRLKRIGEPDDEQYLPPFLAKDAGDFENFITPIYAAAKGNEFLDALISEIGQLQEYGQPWMTTGNMLCTKLAAKLRPEITVWPMHYFLNEHPRTAASKYHYIYTGKDKIFAKHFWGTTRRCYDKGIEK